MAIHWALGDSTSQIADLTINNCLGSENGVATLIHSHFTAEDIIIENDEAVNPDSQTSPRLGGKATICRSFSS